MNQRTSSPAPAPPPVPRDGAPAPASRAYFLPMGLLLALVVGLLVYEYTRNPLPPGVDPGHWLSAAYSYVGLPSAPDPANRPLFYSPLIFPFLGGLFLVTRDAATASTIFAALLLTFYGLSVIHLARRFLRTGVVQVAFVGGALLCGTTLQMLYWGAYPNYLGFIFFNESMLLFLLYVRARTALYGLGFFTAVAVTYFAHDLSFFVLLACLGGATIFLLLFGKMSWRFLVEPQNLAGVLTIAGIVEGYSLYTARLGIPHPSYFYSNSSAYVIDEIGEIFEPLGHAPAFLPRGTVLYFGPFATVALLLSASLIAVVVLALVRRARPDRVNARVLIAAGWLCGAAAVPALGYLVHVDTDYTRFLYFLPLPFALLAVIALEQGLAPYVPLGAPPALPAPEPPRARSADRRRRPLRYSERRGSPVVAASFVGLVLMLLFFTVTVPVAQASEYFGAGGPGHQTSLLEATRWLKENPAPGGVITQPTVARWVEALSDRQEFTVGPVWLLFNPFQVVNAEETFWASNAAYAVTNSQVVLSYSGFNSSVFSQDPMYSPYIQGVPFPTFRVLPGGFLLNVTAANGTQLVPLGAAQGPIAPLSATDRGDCTVIYQNWAAQVIEIGTPLSGGQAAIQFYVHPAAGVAIHAVTVTLDRPPYGALALQHAGLAGIYYSDNGTLAWTVSGRIGQYPVPADVTSTIAFSEPATQQGLGPFAGGATWRGVFPDPNGSKPFQLGLTVSTPRTSNPTHSLPRVFDSASFLASESIHFIFWSNARYFAEQLFYFEVQFGFRIVYSNSAWVILER